MKNNKKKQWTEKEVKQFCDATKRGIDDAIREMVFDDATTEYALSDDEIFQAWLNQPIYKH